MNEINKIEAIKSLSPNAEVSQHGDVIIWHKPSTATVTEAEIQTEVDRLQAEYTSQEYARERESAFALIGIGDQLDMQYWDQVNGTTIWKDLVTKVKSDNPK